MEYIESSARFTSALNAWKTNLFVLGAFPTYRLANKVFRSLLYEISLFPPTKGSFESLTVSEGVPWVQNIWNEHSAEPCLTSAPSSYSYYRWQIYFKHLIGLCFE